MKKRSRSLSVLGSALCWTLGSGWIGVSCQGTETDNPVASGDVFDGTSPENFSPRRDIAGCPPIGVEEQTMLPSPLAQAVAVPGAGGRVLATGSYQGGLSLLDASDPENPVELSRGVVEGAIHQLLLAPSGELWVLATEPPRFERAALPSATALDPVLRLVRVDVSDPAHPVRIAEATLEGEAWELRERDGEAWVLSARRSAAERACSATDNPCGYRSHEALLLSGFRPTEGSLEPIAMAELPFEQRAWFTGDGVVTRLADGSLHATGWDSAGALFAERQVPSGGGESAAGPAEIEGSELSVVRVDAGQARIEVYDLASPGATPIRSTPLGPRSEAAGIRSLFAEQHLWLQAPYGNGNAELWDLTGAAPVRVALPQPFHTVLPIAGATREGQPGEMLAIGALRDASSGNDELKLLSIQDGVASEAEAPELDAANLSLNNGVAAPGGVVGTGEASAWVLRTPGLGRPIAIEPARSAVPAEPRFTTAFVGVTAEARAPGETPASDAVTGVALVEGYESGRGIVAALELSGTSLERRIELSPQMRALVPTATSVVTVATSPASECEQTGIDCTGYAPGVSVFDVSGEPRLVATLPFPELPLPPSDDPNRLSVRWDLYDPLTQQQPAALDLGDGRLAFVASAYLSCDNQQDCDALEVTAVPIREANVAISTPAPCMSDVDPGCDPTPPPAPSVWGESQRQYFYVLDVEAAGGPSWEAWGVSRLEATARRTDRESRFAFPLATDGVLAATRLERRRSATDVNDTGSTRFYLDRFERSQAGDIVALAPVNVPGYPVARLGGDAVLERWLSVEALPGETGEARLHRMNVQSDGARIEQTLDLGGAFEGFRELRSGEARLGLMLLGAEDGCGTTELSAIAFGDDPADPGQPLAIASTLELPSDEWQFAASDGDLVLMQRGFVYVLVRAAADGTLRHVSSSSVDVYLESEQLLGTSLFGGSGQAGPRRFELLP